MTSRRRLSLPLGLVLAAALVGSAPLPVLGADTTDPVVTPPVAIPKAGATVKARAIPVRVSWSASDGGSGIVKTALQVSVDGGSWAKVRLHSRTATHARVTLMPPHDAQFRARARDAAGNRSEWAYGETVRWQLARETDEGVETTPSWRAVTASGYLGDRALVSGEAGAELSLRFTGTQVAWIGRLRRSGGEARVYLDGAYRTTVSSAGAKAYRRILYTARWPEPGEHTITVRVSGTPGHPDVTVDGFVLGGDPPADPVLVGAGDIASCAYADDSRTAALLDRIPGRVFAAGDTAYPRGSTAQFRDCYGPTWGRWRLRTSPAIGNHEYKTASGGPYWDYFGARAGTRGDGWYAYDLGTWRIYTLNTNCDRVGCDAGSRQEQWLRADLAAHPRACVAAVMHQPLFSTGFHGDNPGVRPLWQALEDAGADVILAGHDHDYERFAPQMADGEPSASGIREFVVGTGGGELREFPGVKRDTTDVRNASTHGVLQLTLHEGWYAWAFVPVSGATFTDAGTATCH